MAQTALDSKLNSGDQSSSRMKLESLPNLVQNKVPTFMGEKLHQRYAKEIKNRIAPIKPGDY